ncbi:MAG: P-type conjugative transfer ATPase TrbB [Burkholderiaceae bacterium]
MDSRTEDRLLTKLRRELGPYLTASLGDPSVVEVMVNPDGEIWVEQMGKSSVVVGRISQAESHSIIATVAAVLGRVVNAESPILEGELPTDGSRFEGLLPPVVSAPVMTIRKRASQIFSLDDYVRTGIMSGAQRAAISKAVTNRKNILICGGTGSGKTTLTNAVIAEIVALTPDDRLVLIEDTYELQCSAKNHVALHATENISMDRLLRATLRMRPDRILVGEVRGPEALALLKSWNTGHPGGIATLHANSALGALTRLEQLTGEATATAQHLPALIAEAVDLIVFIQRSSSGRQIKEIAEVHATTDGQYQIISVAPKVSLVAVPGSLPSEITAT